MSRFRIWDCGFWIFAALVFAGCASYPADTPTAALKSYIAAQQKGDIAAMKRLLSKASVEFIEKNAQVQNRSIDDVLRDETKVKIAAVPAMRNEKIDGDNATVEVRDDQTGNYDLIYPFVREDGEWRLARDKQIEAILKKANEEREKMIIGIRDESLQNTNSKK